MGNKNLTVVYSARTYWWVIPMPPVLCPEFFWAYTGTFIFYVLKWNGWASTMVAGNVRKVLKS